MEDVGTPDTTRHVPSIPRHITLPGGRTLEIRPSSIDDAGALGALYSRLTADDLHSRFFSYYRPDRSFCERMVTVADRGGFGLVAVVHNGREHDRETGESSEEAAPGAGLVAHAAYEPMPNGDGELAMTVDRRWRGWLGPLLLDALLDVAASRGIPNLECDILVTNRPMLALVRARGYATVPADDWESLHVVVGTAAHVPTWPGPHARPRVLVEVPGGHWHATRAAEDAGLQIVTCSGPRGRLKTCPVLSGRPCPLAVAADAIVITRPVDDESWRAMMEEHRPQHPGVPILVEYPVEQGAPEGAMQLPTGVDDQTLVEIIARIARGHATRSDLWVGDREPPESLPPDEPPGGSGGGHRELHRQGS